MPRPTCCRRIAGEPGAVLFKPAGIPARDLESVTLKLDEFEALRLSALEGLYQDGAAARMGISRATFGRILASAHQKIADVLVHGKVLRIEGGTVVVAEKPSRPCERCARAGRCRCRRTSGPDEQGAGREGAERPTRSERGPTRDEGEST